ncbi:MAG: hypothetical protein FWE15_29980 [Actinomycetia bacterium]|nr:hypothetical protein [Actinomycetes bacterium]
MSHVPRQREPLPDPDEPEHDGEQVAPNPEPADGDAGEQEHWDPGAPVPPGTGDPARDVPAPDGDDGDGS